MKILVIGASQGTGAHAVKEALARGHEVTAFSRSPDKIGFDHPKLIKCPGDFHQAKSVAEAVVGHDAVIITASATSLKAFKDHPDYFSKGTLHVIQAMEGSSANLVVLSALGTGNSRSLLPWLIQKLMIDLVLKLPFADHNLQEKAVQDSALNWIIARPGRLTNGLAKKQYMKKASLEKVPPAISRADVADFLVDAATTTTWRQKIVHLGG